jgi:hypothetical protein
MQVTTTMEHAILGSFRLNAGPLKLELKITYQGIIIKYPPRYQHLFVLNPYSPWKQTLTALRGG